MKVKNKILLKTGGHLIFWMLSFIVLMLIFNISGKINAIDFIYALIFHFTIAPLVYLTYYFIAPYFLSRRRVILFPLLIFPAIALFSVLNEMLFSNYADVIFPRFYFVSFFSLPDIVILHFIYVLITILVFLSGSWFREIENKKRIIELDRENINSELQMLKSQVNPHFFFNTLQNLYALSLKKADELPEMMLKLSGLMRYVIYEANVSKIRVSKEIDFINNYLELEKLRLPDGNRISFKVEGKTDEIKIPPLLLIHFIENCFKHGLKGETKNAWADLRLELTKNHLIFTAGNNKRKVKDNATEKIRGFGIENVKRRLQLVYPQKHELTISDGPAEFNVYLKIDLL